MNIILIKLKSYLRIKMEKYKFRKYDSKFQELFKREKVKLKKILPNDSKIEHVGSTAVKGLGGKGVLDVMISVPKGDIKKVKEQLEKANYIFKESGGERDRLFFKKNYKYGGEIRIVHIQLTSHNSYISKRMIKFRDLLIKDKAYAKEYADIKRKAAEIAKGEGKIYRKHKEKIFE